MEDSSENTKSNESSEEAKEDAALTELKEKSDKLMNDYLYLKADFENYKKRSIKEQSDIRKYGSEHLVRALLDVVDNFERAMSVEIKPENLKTFSEGIQMIHSEIKSTLSKFGVSEVGALGSAFDPNVHEAMGTEVSEEFPNGHICKVFTKPYKLHDKIIRTGKVIIAQEPKKDA